MTIGEMTLLNMQERMARVDSAKKLPGMFQKIGVGVTENYPTTEFLKGVLNNKHFSAVVHSKWSRPFPEILLA